MVQGLRSAALAGTVLAAAAGPAPDLSRTDLYMRTARDCHAVDLSTWRHPARTVLEAAKVRIRKVELCNEARFPVFTVALPFEPDSAVNEEFNQLIAQLAVANGFWPYALVDTERGAVLTAMPDRRTRTVTTSMEDITTAR